VRHQYRFSVAKGGVFEVQPAVCGFPGSVRGIRGEKAMQQIAKLDFLVKPCMDLADFGPSQGAQIFPSAASNSAL